MEDQQLRSAIEALLFIAGNPVTVERLKGVFEDASREQIEAQLNALRQEHEGRAGGIMLAEIAGGWQFVTRPEHAAWVRKFRTVKSSARLSRPALETLAIIAYKQPVTRTEIEAVRGVNVDGIVRNLMERRLIKIVGKKDIPGKPMLFGTSMEFLQHFGMKDLSSLPTLKEFQELDASEETLVDQVGEAAGAGSEANAESGEPVETATAPETRETG